MKINQIFFSTLFLTTFTLVFLIAPTPTAAQGLAQLAQCSGPDCGTCEVVRLANGLIMWLITFVFLLFAVLLMRAGIKLVTSGGNPGALQSAKDSFINALIGLIIILAAWLIVDTLMRTLVGDVRSGALVWSSIECTAQVTPNVADQVYIELHEINFNQEFIDVNDALPVPSGSTGSNCGVNESALVSIPGQGGHRATPDVAGRFVAMRNMLASRGITLSVTSSYRSDARQTQLWDNCPICQRQGTVARPCSRGGNGSKHTSGVALDLTSSGNRSDIINACRSAGASFTMTYERSGHVHCDWR